MRRFYSRFRFTLMAFGLGLAAVYMWQGLSLSWWGVPVDLPEARSASVIDVAVPLGEKPPGPRYLCDEFPDANERASCLHHVTFEDRDMSLYDDGGRQGCSLEFVESNLSCNRSLQKARRFVWEHWKKRKRGYVAVTKALVEQGESVTHLFIEPKADGSWRIDARWVPRLRGAEKLEHYLLGDLIEVKWNRATAEDSDFYGLTPGTMYLRLINITRDSFIL